MKDVRKAGLLLIAASLAVIAVLLAFHYYPITIWVAAIYALAALILGLLVVITGQSVRGLSAKWMALAGWQRGVLGAVVVVLVLAAIFYVVVPIWLRLAL
jgi:hypothetical protein